MEWPCEIIGDMQKKFENFNFVERHGPRRCECGLLSENPFAESITSSIPVLIFPKWSRPHKTVSLLIGTRLFKINGERTTRDSVKPKDAWPLI